MSRKIADLAGWMQLKALELVAHAERIGLFILITQTLRTMAEQDALYQQGRSKPGKVVTKARAGQSPHNYGLAFDIAFVDPGRDGVTWDEPRDGAWEEVGKCGESLGLVWGGRWKAFPDRPHFEAQSWRAMIGAPNRTV